MLVLRAARADRARCVVMERADVRGGAAACSSPGFLGHILRSHHAKGERSADPQQPIRTGSAFDGQAPL